MRFIGLIKRIEGEDQNTYHWYSFQENILSINKFKGIDGEFMRMYNSNKLSLIIELTQDFIRTESQMNFAGEKTKIHEEAIDRLKAYISWSINTRKKEDAIQKGISAAKKMKEIYSEFHEETEDKVILIFIAKSIYELASEKNIF
jgi:hypothetical protein